MSKLAMSLLLGLMAKAGDPHPTCLDASLDRIEITEDTEDEYGRKVIDGLAVLDVQDYPGINVPMEMAEGIPEGSPIKVCVYTSGAELRFFLTRRSIK